MQSVAAVAYRASLMDKHRCLLLEELVSCQHWTGFPLKSTPDIVVARIHPGVRVITMLPVQSGLSYFGCAFCAAQQFQ